MRDRGRAGLAGVLPDVVRGRAILVRCDRRTGVGGVLLERGLGGAARFASHGVGLVLGAFVPPASGPMLDNVVVIVVGRSLAQQPFTIGDRDAVVVRMD